MPTRYKTFSYHDNIESMEILLASYCRRDNAMTVNASARNALKVLLDEAELRGYEPPVPGIVVSELEWIIGQTAEQDPHADIERPRSAAP